MSGFQSDLRRLARPLTEGLSIRHIAHFGLKVCSAKDDQNKVLARPKLAEYDQIPVQENSRIVGILERDGAKSLSGKRRPLDEGILLSADAPLAAFILTVRDQPYRLVVDGAHIKGIVTRSDLLKVPVLSLGYSLLAQLELLANRAIEIKYKGTDDWLLELEKLDKNQARRIKVRKDKATEQNLSLPTTELADLVDKLRVTQDFLPSEDDFETELREAVEFRNAVDHVKALVPSNAHLDLFVRRFEIVIQWIVAIEKGIARRSH